MLKRTRGSKWSLLIMRGADRNVRQFQVSRRSIIAAPAVAVLAVSGCIAGLQFRSAYHLHLTEQTLATQRASFAQNVQAKDKKVALLQQEIDRLKQQTSDMEDKLTDLQELEAKLKQFTDAYSSTVHQSAPVQAPEQSITNDSYSPTKEAHRMIKLAMESKLDFRAFSSLIDTMAETMTASLKRDQLRRAEQAAIPSGWPTRSHMLTSGFGYRTDPFTGRSTFHAGIDIAGKQGDAVIAAADGVVLETGTNDSKGNYIIIKHTKNLKTTYYHLKRIVVNRNDIVVRGEKIGLLGSTGRSTAPHLHFQIMQEDEPVNPFNYLRLVKED
ncbi:hypothetical protein Back11_31620 [Paenibacillus baekrokdamisoli]|uniref:M23ase beta-sheet core domain-containing protein n=1 Tax=Paenibacillus baekrokdamisoli TaxID=1712516 RepID=A0A3G9ISL7_9BACL|nr:peptidoglycan DD-metalloendopeptidase family protein [Paenibacillus baekrokdamisoli]MBB3071674.1 murein DD-endopeptidase MepM/ murein hydrolase activator NlpD [Paenibacillus baekrokdamisoli]BBH21817.1 hypothetical protein Back11_31620 [Paenibacillus baekrokdamisoli]